MLSEKKHRVPLQSLIDHIKTACDVDPWAKEMAEYLLKNQSQVVHCRECKYGEPTMNAKGEVMVQCSKNDNWLKYSDWFCADAEQH